MTSPTFPHPSESNLLAPQAGSQSGLPEGVAQAIVNALRGLRFGQVTLIVHDGRVMQIDRTDRHRLQPNETANKTG